MNKHYQVLFLLLFPILFLLTSSLYASKHIIEVRNFEFDPAELTTVLVGDTIRWEWISGHHTTTSTSIIPEGAASWDSPITPSVTFFEYVVEVPGTYHYVCTPHLPGMVATFHASPAQTLAVEPDNQDVSYEAGNTNFSVFSNSAWTAESDADWCDVTPSGDGNGSIIADYEENTTFEIRIATITVSVNSMVNMSVTVTQEASTISVGEVDVPGFEVFPNPASGSITLNLERIAGNEILVYVMNMEGKVVMEGASEASPSMTMDLSALPGGPYLMVIKTETEQYSKRILVSDR